MSVITFSKQENRKYIQKLNINKYYIGIHINLNLFHVVLCQSVIFGSLTLREAKNT